MAKDTRLVQEYAQRLGVQAPAGRIVQEILIDLRDRGLGDRDVSYLAEVRAREANARIEPQDS